jgi:ribonuclease-3
MTLLLGATWVDERIDAAERILGYCFFDKNLLLSALTHPSAAEEDPISCSYERLEFLGDSIMGAIIAQEIYDRFPQMDEGGMTRIKVSLVSGETLARRAGELGFGELIIFGSSERGTGKRGLHSALENVYEALVAALALDGGYEVARCWVRGTLAPYISEQSAAEPENPKSTLQEILQVDHVTPTYELVMTEGPPHERVFTSNVLSEGKVIGTGTGHSKKDAEAKAAVQALKAFRHRRKPR